jgi:hypothetical protein
MKIFLLVMPEGLIAKDMEETVIDSKNQHLGFRNSNRKTPARLDFKSFCNAWRESEARGRS